MLLKKYIKNRHKLKIILLLAPLALIVLTIIVLSATQNTTHNVRLPAERTIAAQAIHNSVHLVSIKQNGIIVPEKYDERKIKARIMQYKMEQIKQQKQQQIDAAAAGVAPISGEEHTTLDVLTKSVHIFYTAPVSWYKTKKVPNIHFATASTAVMPKPVRIINTAFYPALGLYKPTSSLLTKHFENIRNCGIGVLILSYSVKINELQLYQQILDLVPNFNLSVTFEINVANNQSVDYLRQQLLTLHAFSQHAGFYKVYALKRAAWLPVIYISNAYKLSETLEQLLCPMHTDSLRHTFNGYIIGHIRLKNHADIMRKLCFDGFYSKLPSNGATFASTWKNWSYLKTFALTYKMLFVPTVGPGFAERNKFPRHGDIQRHRSNGRYYGVAWRTAILNHVGFINIASYNNWADGSQIEEVIPRAGFLDYNPGLKTKYLDLTTHWVGNFLKTRQSGITQQQNCYELLNNTIC